jgi:hypothetical protein
MDGRTVSMNYLTAFAPAQFFSCVHLTCGVLVCVDLTVIED